jgi:nucleotide-binding universal stress UspA family protein
MNDAPILICYDGTDASDRAIQAAATLFPGRRAVVLNVGSPLTVAESSAILATGVPGTSFETVNEEDAMESARAGAERAQLAGLQAEARAIVEAPSWEGVVDVAEEIDAAVIVMGSHVRGRLREVVEGSVPHDVFEHARRPVLVVPSPGGRR